MSASAILSLFRRNEWREWFTLQDTEDLLRYALFVASAWDGCRAVGIATLFGDGRFYTRLDTLLVHAGTHPNWSVEKTLARAAEVEQALRGYDYPTLLGKMYGNTPNYWSGGLSGYKRLRFIINCLTRMRMVTVDGHLDLNFSGSPWRARKGLRPWYQAPKPAWQGTRIVFGHWSALGLIALPDLISLDTGCVWGRELTAVRLDKRLPRVIQVRGQEL